MPISDLSYDYRYTLHLHAQKSKEFKVKTRICVHNTHIEIHGVCSHLYKGLFVKKNVHMWECIFKIFPPENVSIEPYVRMLYLFTIHSLESSAQTICIPRAYKTWEKYTIKNICWMRMEHPQYLWIMRLYCNFCLLLIHIHTKFFSKNFSVSSTLIRLITKNYASYFPLSQWVFFFCLSSWQAYCILSINSERWVLHCVLMCPFHSPHQQTRPVAPFEVLSLQ